MLADETFLQLLQSGPHWAMEFVVEAVTGLAVYPLIRLAVRKHDERRHPTLRQLNDRERLQLREFKHQRKREGYQHICHREDMEG